MIAAAVFVILPLCLAMAAFSDLFTMTIPNRVSLILIASFLILAPLTGLSLEMIGMHLAGAAIVFSACFALFTFNVMGGGDAKLLSATALWFGLNESLLFLMTDVAAIGGLITLLILLVRTQSNTILAIGLPVPNSVLLAKKIPYGIAIAIGGFMAFPSSPLFIAALESLK
ncbi:A24 family peptidase [Rhizobium leguminosarum]|uniref:Peptidase n=1 Tax=Rhizobium leguminosarum TaxID=384 RepID=A0A6P0DB51_RHILE|nr:prepilin peptidase [Rhizobium leguminosarum]ASS54904.1 peptidase [Rhizobium leguminosarum bv. viciae]AVC52336.1 type IV leader peptidase family protein [Rhizobium leguminosarum bv. viciae]MBB4327944.1 prepilin peptidase CpaA [Rhizobium leguminosarum]MBB4341905.1 prepilin peptidase CpaA [Rhizobium leguminosarum]MBB4353609.1 prepilin peptidase CpaA [Rhizobium leguminosarum]